MSQARRGRRRTAFPLFAAALALSVLAGCTGSGKAAGQPAPSAAGTTTSGAHGAGRSLYVSPQGSDQAPGTLSHPWRTLAHSVSQLRPGDTLYLRQGTYRESDVHAQLAGSADRPITIRSYPNEHAVVDGSSEDFATAPNSSWTLFDPRTSVYRSTQQVPVPHGGNSSDLTAWLLDQGVQLTHYGTKDGQNPSSLQSTNYSLHGFSPVYIGPGIQLRADGHLYIRLTQNPMDLTDSAGKPIPAVPTNPDPRKNRIAVSLAETLLFLEHSHDVTFQGIGFAHAYNLVRLESGTERVTFDGCTFTYGSYGIQVDDASAVNVVNSAFDGGVPGWVYWTDVKNGKHETSNAPDFQSDGITGVLSGWQIAGNTFRQGWDGVQVKTGTKNAVLRDNLFSGNRDDVVEVRAGVSNVEIAHNMMWHVHDGIGITRDVGGTRGPIYVHHNVIDVTRLNHIGRAGNYRGTSDYPVWGTGSPFEGHSSGDGRHELRFYNNTVVARYARGSNGMGPQPVTPTSELYVYNNIWYAIDDMSILTRHPLSSGAHYDGDVFWRLTGSKPMFVEFGDGGSYASLSQFLAATGNRWESHGLQVDPMLQLAADATADDQNLKALWQMYRPANPRIATIGVPYNGLGWPGVQGVNYRGALPPGS